MSTSDKALSDHLLVTIRSREGATVTLRMRMGENPVSPQPLPNVVDCSPVCQAQPDIFKIIFPLNT